MIQDATPAPAAISGPARGDRRAASGSIGVVAGLVLAVVSAAAFATSGAVAKSLLVQGWSPGAVVTLRVALGALLLLGPAAVGMRGRWDLLRRRATWAHTGLFGLVAVAGCQLAYFLAVQRLSVGVALMLEYLAPILVVVWYWLVRGRRPRRLTVLGTVVALLGLLLVLDVLGDVRINPVGVGWGLVAAVGLACFFLTGADDASGLPPLAFSCLGMAIGAGALAVVGVLGVVPMRWSLGEVHLAGGTAPWWVPVVWLGVVAAAVAYATGIVAARALGATVSSFVGLTEVVFAVLWAWLLLGEMPALVQLVGGVLILAGVVCVKLDERAPAATPSPAQPPVGVEPIPQGSTPDA